MVLSMENKPPWRPAPPGKRHCSLWPPHSGQNRHENHCNCPQCQDHQPRPQSVPGEKAKQQFTYIVDAVAVD